MKPVRVRAAWVQRSLVNFGAVEPVVKLDWELVLDAGDQLVAYLAQQAQAPRGRAHPTGAAVTRTAPALGVVA